MSNIETHFIKPLSEFYGRNPFGPGFARRLEPYAQTLSADALQAIATRLIERGGKAFPSFTNCREALSRGEAALTPMGFEPRAWETHKRDSLEWDRRLAAIKICRCSMGETADNEGWLPALLEFCEDNNRLPYNSEIGHVKAKARRSEDALHRAQGSPFFKSLVGWRKNMLDRARSDVFGHIEMPRAAE
jgi:hypothetical protein